jgi:hypothetical protein
MRPASIPQDDMPQPKKTRTKDEGLPVYEVQELPVERRVQPGRFYVQKNGELREHERRRHADAAPVTPRKPTPGR